MLVSCWPGPNVLSSSESNAGLLLRSDFSVSVGTMLPPICFSVESVVTPVVPEVLEEVFCPEPSPPPSSSPDALSFGLSWLKRVLCVFDIPIPAARPAMPDIAPALSATIDCIFLCFASLFFCMS